MIACSQPRRVACVSVASRVAAECGCALGQLVGFSIRFEERVSSSTRLCYITDGMLLRQALSSPLLLQYAVVIVDEAHERSINTDVLCLLLRRIQRERRSTARPPLKLIVMSATLDADVFLRYFAPCPPCLLVEGRRWEVEVLYAAEPQEDYVDAAVTTVLQIHLYEGEGDVLVFLPGQEDIEAAAVMLEEKRQLLQSNPASSPVQPPPAFSFLVLPLYAALAHEQQLQVFASCSPLRKVVLATNIAETSLTIPGIAFVVDTGVAKHRHFDPATQLDVLRTADISKAEAWQRSGRAGRERAGKAFRLYTEAAFAAFAASPSPALVNGNLASTVLQLKAAGVEDVLAVDWLSAPRKDVLRAALEHLLALGALETDGRLSSDGRGMVALPLDVDLAHALLLSARPEWGCAEEMATVVAMLTVGNVFAGGAGGSTGGARGGGGGEGGRRLWSGDDGDHLILLRVWREWLKHGVEDEGWCREMRLQRRVLLRVQQVRIQLLDTMQRLGLQAAACSDDRQTRKCIAFAFSLRIARRETVSSAPPSASDSYVTLFDHQRVWLHPSSALAGRGCQYVCYHELLMTRRKYMRQCCRVEEEWVREMRERETAAAAGERGRELMTERVMQRLALAGAGERKEAASESKRQREESSAAAAASVRKKPKLMLSQAARPW